MGHWPKPLVKMSGRFSAPKWLKGAFVAVILSASAAAHPLHTTIGELTYERESGEVVLTITVFADDFEAATAKLAPEKSEPHRSVHYLARRLQLRGSDDRVVVLQWAGAEAKDDVIEIRLVGRAPAGLRGGTLHNGILLETFSDQVNIVKTKYGEADRTLLFTRRGVRKRLP